MPGKKNDIVILPVHLLKLFEFLRLLLPLRLEIILQGRVSI